MRRVLKQLLSSADASIEERRAAKERRSEEFGIEVVEGTALSPRADGPVVATDADLALYGDPVNFLYPLGVRGGTVLDRNRTAAARAAFKGARGASRGGPYEREASRRVVHTRIVEAEFEVGITPGFNPDDDLDALLPSELFEQHKAGITRGTSRAKGLPMAQTKMETIRQRIATSKNNLGGGGMSELDQAIEQARANKDENMVNLLLAAQAKVTRNFQGTPGPAPGAMSAGPAVAADDPPLAPPVVTPMPPPAVAPATAFSSNNSQQPTRVAPPPGPGPAVPSASFGPSNAPRETTGGSGVGLSRDLHVRQAERGDRHVDVRHGGGTQSSMYAVEGIGVEIFGTDDQVAEWYGKAEATNSLMCEPPRRRFQGNQPWHRGNGAAR